MRFSAQFRIVGRRTSGLKLCKTQKRIFENSLQRLHLGVKIGHSLHESLVMGSYKSKYPSGLEFDSSYKQFFEQFYKFSDTPDAHEEYAKQFTKDATYIMASKTMQGSSGMPLATLLMPQRLTNI